MCPLPSEINTPPYYRDLMSVPMGSPYMFNELGTGIGCCGGMYPMGGAYGAYFPPYLYGVRIKQNPKLDMYVNSKEDIENKNNFKKFFKYAGIAIGTAACAIFLKGKMIKGAQNANAHTFWTKFFNIKVPGLGKPRP